jgi:hypothetical protein
MKISIRISGLWTEILTQDLPNIQNVCYPFDCDVQCFGIPYGSFSRGIPTRALNMYPVAPLRLLIHHIRRNTAYLEAVFHPHSEEVSKGIQLVRLIL